MTREDARKAAEVMLAYADGKEIEIFTLVDNTWRQIDNPGFDWVCSDFRIKLETKYRPFKNAEECWNEMQKHQPFGWIKDKETREYMSLQIVGDDKKELEKILSKFTFADGEPFGVKEEE